MYPGYNYMWHPYRGGSRILWFILGGVATSLWFRHKDNNAIFGCGPRRAIQAPSSHQVDNGAPPAGTSDGGNGAANWDGRVATPSPRQASWRFGQTPPLGWEEEKQRMLALGKQAGDTVRHSSIIISDSDPKPNLFSADD